MPRIGVTLDHELGLLTVAFGLDPDARHVAVGEAALESRSHADLDARAVRAGHGEEQSAGFGWRERLDWSPAKSRCEPADEKECLRRQDLPAVHVHREPDPHSGHRVEERPPGRNVEEARHDLAPRGEARPVEVGQAEAAARLSRDPRDRRQHLLGPREVGRVHHEPVGETDELAKGSPCHRWAPRPPQEHRKVWHKKRDDDAREPFIGVAPRSDEDLFVADLRRVLRGRQVAVHLQAPFGAFVRAAIREEHDRPRGVARREIRDALRRSSSVQLAVGVDDEVQHGRAGNGARLLARVRALSTPQPFELALERHDAGGLGAPERGVDGHALRHARPSSLTRASASAGPQVPAS